MIRRLLVAAAFAALPACEAMPQSLDEAVRLPPGFSIAVYARAPEARTLVPVPELGAVLVGQRRGDTIHAILDPELDGVAEGAFAVRRGLKSPNGLAWRDGYLYVAEQHRLIRLKASSLDELAGAAPEVLFDGLPDDSWHGWRYAAFAPDGSLFVSVGAPCNVCETQGYEGAILRFDPATWRPTIYASGVRNAVGMAFHPASGELYFTDNGADGMGDDSPPDEFNRASAAGAWFGFPYFGGGDHRTPDFADGPLPREATFPAVAFGAHVAALGFSFYQGGMFPPDYAGDAFVAQHGSWNRSVPDGYRVVRVTFEDGRATGYEPFADGFLRSDGVAWGRPVDVKPLPDGSLLVSDDRQDVIYRITYGDGAN